MLNTGSDMIHPFCPEGLCANRLPTKSSNQTSGDPAQHLAEWGQLCSKPSRHWCDHFFMGCLYFHGGAFHFELLF